MGAIFHEDHLCKYSKIYQYQWYDLIQYTRKCAGNYYRNRMNKNRVFYTLWIPAKRKWESRPVKLNSCERMSHEENKEELVSTFYQKGYIQDRSVETSNKRCQSFLHVIRWLEYATSEHHILKAKIRRCPTFLTA